MRQAFYDAVTRDLFRGTLPASQREPLDRLIDEGLRRERSLEETAYVLATAYHETGRFLYMEEIGRGEGHAYGEPVMVYRGEPRRFYGRGFVHLTWLHNYGWGSSVTGVNLILDPERAKEPAIAAKIIWEGMIMGAFSRDGSNLSDYIRDGAVDYVNARKTVNLMDKADLIAGYAEQFEAALRLIEDEPAPTGCPIRHSECPRQKEAA